MSIEVDIVKILKEKNMKVSFAESCTGGMLVSTLINASGASSVIDESYVTYASSSKEKILGVEHRAIECLTVYSNLVALQMAKGLKKITNADFCVSVTGLTDTGHCEYHFAIVTPTREIVCMAFEDGTRNEVRKKQTENILHQLYVEIQEEFLKD